MFPINNPNQIVECTVNYYGDMAQYLHRIDWKTPLDSYTKEVLEKEVLKVTDKETKDNVDIQYEEISHTAGYAGYARYYQPKQPNKKITLNLVGYTILVAIHWESTRPKGIKDNVR